MSPTVPIALASVILPQFILVFPNQTEQAAKLSSWGVVREVCHGTSGHKVDFLKLG